MILVVEDDHDLNKLLHQRLSDAGYTVKAVYNGQAALHAVEQQVPDLVILDVMLPGIDGIEVCKQLRAKHPLLYVIMLTAKNSEIDRIIGLEVGADDYVTKPFSLEELGARVRSALRRLRLEQVQQSQEGDGLPKIVENGGLYVDAVKREVKKNGELLYLTVKEFDLLYFLIAQPDRPFTRAQLLDKVWDIQYEGYDRTVDSHVQRLRTKIEDDINAPKYVKTVWGVGYKFESS